MSSYSRQSSRTSPYYVDPGYDYSRGLMGLREGIQFKRDSDIADRRTAVMEQRKANEEAEIERKRKVSEEALAAYKSNDSDKIAEVILKYPEIGSTLATLYERRKDYSKEKYANQLEEALTEIETTGNLKPKEEFYDPDASEQFLGFESLYPGGFTGKKPTDKMDIIRALHKKNPKLGKKTIESELAQIDNKKYKAWKEVHRPDDEGGESALLKKINEYKRLKADPTTDPKFLEAYENELWPDKSKDVAPSNVMKMYSEREKLLVEGADPNSDIIKGLDSRILGEAKPKSYSPSGLMKLITERQDFIDKGEDPDSDIIQAYDNRIAGIDINVKEITPEQYKFLGIYAYITGKMPSVGRGKMATKVRMGILKAKADYGLQVAREELEAAGIKAPKEDLPGVAAFNAVMTSTETKAIGGAWNWLEKQEASMGSYVDNIGKQLDELKKLSEDLYSFDARILNVPLRFVRGRIVGSPLQNKYDLFLKEISRETTKLALGATQSIAPPSVEEIKTWDRIHDPALSITDAIDVLEKSKDAANIRYKSVTDQLNRVRERMKTRDYTSTLFKDDEATGYPTVSNQQEYDKLDPGDWYIDSETNLPAQKGKK